MLNRLNTRQGRPALGIADPVVLVTLFMFGWLVLHAIIGAVYRPIRQGRKVAYLTLVSFVFLVVALALAYFH